MAFLDAITSTSVAKSPHVHHHNTQTHTTLPHPSTRTPDGGTDTCHPTDMVQNTPYPLNPPTIPTFPSTHPSTCSTAPTFHPLHSTPKRCDSVPQYQSKFARCSGIGSACAVRCSECSEVQ
eukprot:364647-Chlamydomonas_euryale.AAC.3